MTNTEPRSIQAERVEPYTEADKRAWLSTLSDEYLSCRILMHAWVLPLGYHDSQVNKRPVKVWPLVCDRCGSEKDARIRITRKGKQQRVERDSVVMRYDSDYLAPPGLYVTKDDLWEEWFRRTNDRRS